MQNLTYNELKKFEAKIDKKLFSYINSDENILFSLDNLELNHPYFLEDENKIAFNMWLSTDYLIEDETTIIDKFLNNKNSRLGPKEISYLKERKNSHLSVFEILKYDEEYIYLRDLLMKKDYKLWEPELIDAIDEGEILLARVCRVLDTYNFIGDINHLPSETKTEFLNNILLDFNNVRKAYPQLTIKNYLKQYALNIYRIYSTAIFNLLDMREDVDSYLFNELDEFSSYIERKEGSIRVKEYSTNLINIFEYYLASKNMFLSDFHQVDLYDFINLGIEEGFIDSKASLNSYIRTLVKYIQFLKKKDSKYRQTYGEILEISANRFHFMEKLIHNDIFDMDKSLLTLVNFNKKITSLLDDFEYFILYIGEKNPETTSKNKHLKRKDLIEINNNLDNKFKPLSSAPNQGSFPLIDFFYQCAFDLGIIYLYDDYLDLEPNAISFLKLVDQEKYVILLQYLWSLDYFSKISQVEKTKEDIIKVFISMDPNIGYELSDFPKALLNFLKEALFFLNIFNLVSFKDDISTFKITNMGQKIFRALYESSNDFAKEKIIDLKDFRKNK